MAFRRQRRWLRATVYAGWHNARVGPDAPTVNFFPMRPEPRMQVSWLLRALRMRIGFKPVRGQATFAWDTGTWFDEHARLRLPGDAINGSCLDVSKSRVEAIWEEVSGHSLRIDPRLNSGRMVVKPESNGVHDGRIVTGPTRRRPGFVYQRLIDTRGRAHPYDQAGDHRSRDAGGAPILARRAGVVLRDKPLFCAHVRCGLYGSECEQLLRFAERIGMEFGELDVLRDQESGLIYVIDANRTSFRPALLSLGDLRRSHRAMVPAFRRLLEDRGLGFGCVSMRAIR